MTTCFSHSQIFVLQLDQMTTDKDFNSMNLIEAYQAENFLSTPRKQNAGPNFDPDRLAL